MPFFRILRADLGLEITRLVRDRVLVGRALANDLVINGDFVAMSHCGLCWHDDAYWLTNFAASGTRLNGTEVSHSALLPGDVIECGAYRLQVKSYVEGLQLEVRTDLNQPAPFAEERPEPTPEQQAALDEYWQAQRSAAGMDNLINDSAASGQWRPTISHENSEAKAPSVFFQRYIGRFKSKFVLRLVLAVLALLAITALVFPRAFAPGGLSKAHQRGVSKAAAHARQPVTSQCLSCHGVTGSVQSRCVACHTTESFEPALSVQHTKLNLQCAACHAEHRGASASLTQAAQTACVNCHQSSKAKLHGAAVAYPVNAFGVWSWEGLSAQAWQQHELAGVASDYTLREQFHMLHGEGRTVGRTQCADCHLAGAAPEQLKQNVRESCAQCHALKPAFATEFSRIQSPKQGTTNCFECHTQHGAARNAKASVRKN